MLFYFLSVGLCADSRYVSLSWDAFRMTHHTYVCRKLPIENYLYHIKQWLSHQMQLLRFEKTEKYIDKIGIGINIFNFFGRK